MKAWMKTTTSVLFLRPTQESLETPISSQTVVKSLGAGAGFFSSMDNRKTRGEGTWKRTIFCGSHPLGQTWCRKAAPTGTRLLPSWWTRGSTRSSFIISPGISILAIRQETTKNRGDGWNNRSVIWLKKKKKKKKSLIWRRWDAGWWR